MESRRSFDLSGGSLLTADGSEIEKHAVTICRTYGAGSEQYRVFLEDINASLLSEILDLPKFVPGDIKSSAKSKKNKKRRQRTNRPPLPKTPPPPPEVNKEEETESVVELPVLQESFPPLQEALEVESEEPVLQESFPPVQETLEVESEKLTRTKTLSLNEVKNEEKELPVRRTYSTLPNEQFAMDEQVALQLQSLLREKAELLKENSRLRNENSGLHELLEYATCEATEDDGECSDHEEFITKEAIRCSTIQAWHPPELLRTPDSVSSFGVRSSSSTDDKDTHPGVNQTLSGSFHYLA